MFYNVIKNQDTGTYYSYTEYYGLRIVCVRDGIGTNIPFMRR